MFISIEELRTLRAKQENQRYQIKQIKESLSKLESILIADRIVDRHELKDDHCDLRSKINLSDLSNKIEMLFDYLKVYITETPAIQKKVEIKKIKA